MPVPARGQEQLGVRLAAARRRTGLTQEELARRAGVKLDTVRAIEQGRTRNPGIFTVLLLADQLGVTLDALVTL
jgi:transcriptional regulator with XRE-family HTH domain